METYEMRTCTRCNDDWYDDEEFYRSSATPWCIACEKEARRHGDGTPTRSEAAMASKRIRELARYHARKQDRKPLTFEQRERKRIKDRERWARITAEKNASASPKPEVAADV